MFGINKNKLSTLEEVRKAYENLSEEDKSAFHQSIADRVHESVGAQEEAEGQKDTQTAADREHEAVGEAEADKKAANPEEKPTEKTAEDSDASSDKGEAEAKPEAGEEDKAADESDAGKETVEKGKEQKVDETAKAGSGLEASLAKIVELLEKMVVKPEANNDEDKLAESSKKYATGLSGGYTGEKGGNKFTEADTERFLKNR